MKSKIPPGRRFFPPARLLAPLSLAFFFFLPALGRTQVDEAYKQNDGHIGTKPGETPDQSVTDEINLDKTENGTAPFVLDCGGKYSASVSITERADECNLYVLGPLLEKARQIAQARLDKISCNPNEGCEGRQIRTDYTYSGCLDAEHALARVKMTLLCPRNGPVTTVPPPSPGPQPPPKESTPTDYDPKESGDFLYGDFSSIDFNVKCDSSKLIAYTFILHDPALAKDLANKTGKNPKMKSFYGVVLEAKLLAQKYHDLFKCGPPGSKSCFLRRFDLLYCEWRAYPNPGAIVVTVYFKVECVPYR